MPCTRQPNRTVSAFSLIELLVVIAIIAVVIAIVVPTLGRARTAARNADTMSLVDQFTKASGQFMQDNSGKMPGFFTVRELGAAQNDTRGFTAMQNAMLDLAGGVVAASGPGVLTVGPSNSATVFVDPQQIGVKTSSNKGYFVPRAKYFVPQNGSDGGELATNVDNHRELPHLVDSFGSPIALWLADETAVQKITTVNDFGAADTSAQRPSRFYWNSNAGLLGSRRLGKLGKDQTFDTVRPASLLGRDVPNLPTALTGFLGNPSFPSAATPLLPTAARGKMVVHAAGADGIFLSNRDTGARQIAGELDYTKHFPGFSNNWPLPTPDDYLKRFDDQVMPSN